MRNGGWKANQRFYACHEIFGPACSCSNPFQTMNPKSSFTIRAAALLLFSAALSVSYADDSKLEPGYISLFNGKDLTGWGYKTNNFDGKTASMDGRFTAANGILTVNPRVPRLLQELSTTQQFPHDFNLKLEFRAGTNADSGIFIRKPQLQ